MLLAVAGGGLFELGRAETREGGRALLLAAVQRVRWD